MAKVLHVQVSANMQGSLSRKTSSEFVRQWQEKNPSDTVEVLDLAKNPARVIDADHLVATWGDDAALTEGQRMMKAESSALIAQFSNADVIVIGTPVYNLNVPAGLKAYIDQLVVAGKTFQYTEHGPEGLLKGKKVFILFAGGTPYEMLKPCVSNFFEPYMQAIMGFMGITDVQTLYASGRTPEAAEQALADIKPKIAAII